MNEISKGGEWGYTCTYMYIQWAWYARRNVSSWQRISWTWIVIQYNKRALDGRYAERTTLFFRRRYGVLPSTLPSFIQPFKVLFHIPDRRKIEEEKKKRMEEKKNCQRGKEKGRKIGRQPTYARTISFNWWTVWCTLNISIARIFNFRFPICRENKTRSSLRPIQCSSNY